MGPPEAASTDNPSPAELAGTTAVASSLRVGEYLTDETFLYRVAGVSIAEQVDLEDCYRLDVVRVSAQRVWTRRLRKVTPARASLPSA